MLIVTTSSAHQRHKGLQSMKNGGFSRDVKAAILGNLSNNDSNGYENITWRRNSPSFKLYRAYSISFNSSIFSKFFWSWILKYCIEVHEKKKKVVVLCSHFAQKVKLGTFTLQSCSDGKKKNVQKSSMHVQSCCFVYLNLLLFWRSRWRRRHRCLSSLLLFQKNETAAMLASQTNPVGVP